MKPGPAAGRRFYLGHLRRARKKQTLENLREFLSPCGPWPIVDNNSLKKQSCQRSQGQAEKNHRRPRKKQKRSKAKENAKGQQPEK